MSVIIPVRNGRALLHTQLAALAAQDYKGEFEVVIADNGSTDGTTESLADSPSQYQLDLRIVDASQGPGAAHARNVGSQHARGQLLLFCDHDDQVHSDWISRLVDSFDKYDIVTTAVEGDTLNGANARKLNKIKSPDQLQPTGTIAPCLAGCSFGSRADVYRKLGGMDETWTSHEDIEFGWRAHNEGFRVGYLPEALVAYRFRTGVRAGLTQGREWGKTMARLHAAFPGNGLPEIRALELLVTAVELVIYARRFTGAEWGQLAGSWLGKLQGSIRYRTLRWR